MKNSAENIYDSLKSIQDIEQLINEGETEGQYLECKCPQTPILNKDLKIQLGKAISAFANTGGGVILWGVSTTKHDIHKRDVLSQIEEIGAVGTFKKHIDLACVTCVEPQFLFCQSKIILRKPTDTRGVIITLVPPTGGDPIRTTSEDREFYIRVGDESNKMPYETVRRMFLGTSGPDLAADFDSRLVKLQPDGSWKIPIILRNNSSTVARDTNISITIKNNSSCENVVAKNFKDNSDINPGLKIFMKKDLDLIFKGKPLLVGNIEVSMKKAKIPKRKLELEINIFSDKMRAKSYEVVVSLAKSGFSVKKKVEKYMY